MTNFFQALRSKWADFGLNDCRVLVAVSGGADSVALLSGLSELRQEFGLQLTVGHLDHMLRGSDSSADAEWVKQLCDKWEIPCVIKKCDVKRLSADAKQTLEESARQARYEFLERTAIDQNCPQIALAHTANDQAETILHHILRGTGVAGLRGIPRQRKLSPAVRLIRPLLEVRRSEIESWLAERGQDFRHDASNSDTQFTRNRLRHQLLPLLQTDYNPQVIPALLRLGQQAGEMQDVLTQFAAEALQSAVTERSPNHITLTCSQLATRPLAFRRVCMTELWRQQNWPRKRMSFGHWNQLAELAGEKRGGLSLPHGLTANRRREWLSMEWEPR